MAEQTKIEWCDHTFNPWEGCQKVAPECDNCYAENRDQRFTGGKHWGPKSPRRRTSPSNWNKPRKWNRDHEAFFAAHGRRQRVFCASLADVFDNAVDPQWRADLFDLIRETPNLDWLLLTKRPQNMAKMLPGDWGDGWAHVWLGTSAGTQKTAEQNIPHLLATRAAIRFVSAEPLLGPVDLTRWIGTAPYLPGASTYVDQDGYERQDLGGQILDGLNWIIVGGESGPKARPMHPDWARSLRDQCQAAGVAFFFKQVGEWTAWQETGSPPYWRNSFTGHEVDRHALFPSDWDNAKNWDDGLEYINDPVATHHVALERIGKRAAGRLLDGQEWNEVPG